MSLILLIIKGVDFLIVTLFDLIIFFEKKLKIKYAKAKNIKVKIDI
jgi:hypothetical protein